MKKYIYPFLILISYLMFSCDVLDVDPVNKYSEQSVWNDEDLLQAYVNAQYNSLMEDFGGGSTGQGMRESASDNLYALHNWENPKEILERSVTADNVGGVMRQYNLWGHAYSYISIFNEFLERIPESPVKADLKKRMTGEIKFMRAFLYAEMIYRYGGVPIITKTYKLNEDYTVSRASFEDCVTFILQELDEAQEMLGLAMQKDDELGRASGHACMALKSRLLLYAASPLWNSSNDKTKWQKAADAAAALMNAADAPSGVTVVADYKLEEDYQQLFMKSSGNTEIIFAQYFTQNHINGIVGRQGRAGSSGSGGGNPTQNLVNSYEMINGELPYLDDDYTQVNPTSGYDPTVPYKNRDPRFEASIIHDGSLWQGRVTESYYSSNKEIMPGGVDSQQGANMPANASATSYYMKKFVPEDIPTVGSSTTATNPWVYFRYAEILLNYAEAQYYLGNEDIARTYINKVRSRKSVQMPDIPATVTGANLLKKIRNERRIELAFEGHRYFDVRRWKIAEITETKPMLGMMITKDAVTGIKTYEYFRLPISRPATFDPKFYLLPIPRTEIEKSKNSFPNNEGY